MAECNKFSLIVAIISVFITGNALASQGEFRVESLDNVNKIFENSVSESPFLSDIGRLNIVNSAESYCVELDRIFPNNTSEEQNFIDTMDAAGMISDGHYEAEISRGKVSEFVKSCFLFSKMYKAGNQKKHSLVGLGLSFLEFSLSAEKYFKANSIENVKFRLLEIPMVVASLLHAAMIEPPIPTSVFID